MNKILKKIKNLLRGNWIELECLWNKKRNNY